MSGSARRFSTHTFALAWFFVAACLLGALQVVLADHAIPNVLTGPDNVVVLFAAAALVAAGMRTFGSTSPWLATALITVGAIAGSIGLVWTIVAPFVAIVLIVLCAVDAHRA